jgi:hypothetical protein
MKFLDDTVLDAGLNVIKNGATILALCSAQPTTYAEATTTYDGGASKYCLAKKTGLTSGSFTGPVDDTSGRKLSKTAETGITVDATGTAIYAALCSGTVLLAVTTITSQTVTLGNSCNTPIFKISFPDPT